MITSNRDEHVNRPIAIPPRKYPMSGTYVFYPKDPQSDGTWIASCGCFALCLLNGGLEAHIPKPPYRKSRGQIILDFYQYGNVEKFVKEYDFENIEPFTLVIVDISSGNRQLHEIRWTGEQIFQQELDSNTPRIWSSVTLYSHQVIKEREEWFEQFLKRKASNLPQEILKFHHFGGKGDVENDILMNRSNTLFTQSITQFAIDEGNFTINYEDLRKNQIKKFRIFREC